MNEILKLLNALSADELDNVITCAGIILEKKRKEEAAQALEQEKKRQQEIEALERKLQELKGTPVPAPKAAPVSARASQVVCPHCKEMNAADSIFCSACGQRIAAATPAPAPMPRPAAPAAAAPAFAPTPKSTSGKVFFPNGTLNKWEALPDETSVRTPHEVTLIQPEKTGKYYYSMEVTNKRLLISRQHVAARGTSTAFGMLGSLVTDLAGGGYKPWAEIPLTAIRSCGLRDRKEFVIEADVTFVLKNKKYDEFLPALVNKAKSGI